MAGDAMQFTNVDENIRVERVGVVSLSPLKWQNIMLDGIKQ